MKKLSAYQKLKKKNHDLIQDIHALVMGEGMSKLEVYTKWKLVFGMEEMVMSGSPNHVKQGNGIWDKVLSADKKITNYLKSKNKNKQK